MKTIEHIRDFLDAFILWPPSNLTYKALPWLGPTRAARDDSDIDFVILTDQPHKYLDERQWVKRFGVVEKQQTEDYGKLTSLRVWYQDGVEVEYGITIKDAPN